MAKDRKLHSKAQRLAGIQNKLTEAKRRQHVKDLQTLQRVLDHSARLQAQHPDLFAAVTDAVRALADANGVTVQSIMTEGVMVIGDDGHKVMKSPRDIIKDIAALNPAFKSPPPKMFLDESRIKATRLSDTEFEVGAADGTYLVDDIPSIDRQREAARTVRTGLDSISLATCSDATLQDAMACGYEPAVTEWLRRHPEAEASDGWRLG